MRETPRVRPRPTGRRAEWIEDGKRYRRDGGVVRMVTDSSPGGSTTGRVVSHHVLPDRREGRTDLWIRLIGWLVSGVIAYGVGHYLGTQV